MSRRTVALVLTATALVAGACSSSKHTVATTPPTVSIAPAVTSSAADTSSSAAPSSSAPAASGLSGTWNGTYSGSFTGTFVLNWTQSSSTLSGQINLSTAGTLPVNGTLSGGSINFGTVGSTVITYTGSVSGNSMSGHWQIAGGADGSGTWNASKA